MDKEKADPGGSAAGHDLPANPQARRYVIAWGLALVFYFLEYAARSAPAVMIPELSHAFGMTAVGVSAIVGTYYYTYSVMNLVAGVALDRTGAKWVVPMGIFILAAGCFVFAVSNATAAYVGRMLQGAGSAFAFTGAVYLAVHGFSARRLATAIGATQCFGMLGGWAGQFVVGPMMQQGTGWQTVWHFLGGASLLTGVLLFALTPSGKRPPPAQTGGVAASLLRPYKIVFRNPQSYLCGLVAGLLFVPTTIGDMIWGVAFFQKDLAFGYRAAVSTASMVPLGWVVGCPLVGWMADRIGLRKPVLIGGSLVMLAALVQLAFLPALIPAQLTCFIFGVASGAAMIPYTIIKEANPDEVKGSATGGINFLTFAVTALVGPIFSRLLGKTFNMENNLAHFRSGAVFWIVCVVLAIGLSLLLRETGHAHKAGQSPVPGRK
ncbi:MAG: transporter [Pedosphaera sp.]|nr:transporter [Pedosphaera sp.]